MAVNRQDRIRADHNNLKDPLTQTGWDREKYVKVIRVMIADFEQLNTLLLCKENSDEKLGIMVDLALMEFNQDTPGTDFVLENFPSPLCLLEGAIVQTLMSIGLLHARNALNYSDDGVQIEDWGKDPRILNFANIHMQQYERLKDNLKRTINAGQCFGEFGSEYGWINRIIR